MNNIILYGMRGTGKSTLGKILAEKLGKSFIDLDQYISQKIGGNMKAFVEKKGWDIFRDKEYECLKEVLENNLDIVLSLGGGTITFERNRNLIVKNNFQLIYVYSDLEDISKRIEKDQQNQNKRTSLTGKPLLEELTEIYDKRKDIYEKFYDVKVHNNGDVEQTLTEILEKINM